MFLSCFFFPPQQPVAQVQELTHAVTNQPCWLEQWPDFIALKLFIPLLKKKIQKCSFSLLTPLDYMLTLFLHSPIFELEFLLRDNSSDNFSKYNLFKVKNTRK